MGARGMNRASRVLLGVGPTLGRPWVLIGVGCFAAVMRFQLRISASNPPGFFKDESSFALDAWSIATHLRDQFGGFLPLYFKSFGDYKSPIFVYLLAAVFRITGPQASVARLVGTAAVVAALCVLAIIAFRRSRPFVAIAVVVLAGFCPWLYELGRLAWDSTLYPLGVAAVLLAVDVSLRSQRTLPVRAGYVVLALAFLNYCYAAGRLLAVLLAAALVVLVSRARARWLLAIWCGFALALVPNLVYQIRHPGALTARYSSATFVHAGMSWPTIVARGIANYLRDTSFWHTIVAGDPKPYVEIPGYGNLFAALVILGLLGIVEVLWRRREDRWWLFVICALVLVPVPSALGSERYDPVRLSPQVLLLAVLAIPGLEWVLRTRLPFRLNIGLLAVLAGLTVVQWTHFADVYSRLGGIERRVTFEADVPPLLSHAFAGGGDVYVNVDDVHPLTVARWYAVSHGIPEDRVKILVGSEIPPKGSTVFGRLHPCDSICAPLASADSYWTARAVGVVRFGSGYNAPEQFKGSTHRWMIQNGQLQIENSSGVLTITISGLAFSNQRPRTLTLEQADGHILGKASISLAEAPFQFGPFQIAKGTSTLKLVASPGPAELGPNDPRDASVFLSPLTVTVTSP